MKKIALAAALSVSASTAFAGNMEAPVMEAPIIVEEAAGSSAGIVVPLLILAVVAAAVSM